jgi:hypothetical protein
MSESSNFATQTGNISLMHDVETKSATLTEADEVDPHAGDVDVTLLWHMLSMTPDERLDYHDSVRQWALELRRAGRERYGITGYDEIDPESSPSPEGSGS